jgi:hypothetical protein
MKTMWTTHVRRAGARLLCACAFLTFACRETKPPPTVLTPSGSGSASTPSAPARAVVKIALLQDKTGSVPATRTPALTYADVEALLLSLSNTFEVDVGVGAIKDRGDEPLVRVRIPAPPTRPPPKPTAPLPRNAFTRLRVSVVPQMADTFDETFKAWKADRDARLAEFKPDAVKVLAAPTRGCTDVEAALARVVTMTDEPEARFPRTSVHRWAVLITDGQQTIKRRPTILKMNARVIVVNGEGTQGVLERLEPLRFESPTRALAYIAETEGANGPSHEP